MSIDKYPERNAQIRRLRAMDMGVTEIASELGLTVSVVAGVIFRSERPWHRPNRPSLPSDATLGRVARRAGLAIADIRDIARGGKNG